MSAFARYLVMVFAFSIWLPAQSTSQRDADLKSFLRNFVGNPSVGENGTTKYAAAFVDLNGDGKAEAIVYLWDGGWCGSGGCTALILTSNDSKYRVLTKITVTRLPIRVLTTKTNGWRDLAVFVAGGGVKAGYARLAFDGKKYPGNPTFAPLVRLSASVEGTVAIAEDAAGTPLF